MAKSPDIAVTKPDEETETIPPAPAEKQSSDLVSITITKFGDGQVSTGRHEAGFGDIYAKRGEKLMVSKSVADSLEKRGLAEAD